MGIVLNIIRVTFYGVILLTTALLAQVAMGQTSESSEIASALRFATSDVLTEIAYTEDESSRGRIRYARLSKKMLAAARSGNFVKVCDIAWKQTHAIYYGVALDFATHDSVLRKQDRVITLACSGEIS